MEKNKTNQKGFTLIELLVVIAIIGLLASVVLLSLNSARQKSRDAKRVADIDGMATAMELYFNQCSSYPVQANVALGDPAAASYKLTSGTSATCGANTAATAADGGFSSTGTGTTFIGTVPKNPQPIDNSGAGATQCNTTGNNTYANRGSNYYYNGTATTYEIAYCLGAQTGSYAAGPHKLTEGGIQ